jgi:hypothetical protein
VPCFPRAVWHGKRRPGTLNERSRSPPFATGKAIGDQWLFCFVRAEGWNPAQNATQLNHCWCPAWPGDTSVCSVRTQRAFGDAASFLYSVSAHYLGFAADPTVRGSAFVCTGVGRAPPPRRTPPSPLRAAWARPPLGRSQRRSARSTGLVPVVKLKGAAPEPMRSPLGHVCPIHYCVPSFLLR